MTSLGVESERADVGRDGRTYLPRHNSQAQTGTGGYSFSLFKQLATSTICNHIPVDAQFAIMYLVFGVYNCYIVVLYNI